MRWIVIASWLLVSMSPGRAQSPPSTMDPAFVGQWKVRWQGKTALLEAEMSLHANGGTWQTLSRSKNDACVGREVPIVIEAVTPDSVSMRLDFESVIPGCGRSKVVLQRSGDQITGVRNADLQLTLTKP
jgi:hypothetical protein